MPQIDPSLNDFCDRWLKKAHQDGNDDLSGVIDRFFRLFVVYNKLYEIIDEIDGATIRQKCRKKRQQSEENYVATSFVVEYIGARKLVCILSRENNVEKVRKVSRFQQQGFYVHWDRRARKPDYVKDTQCIQAIERVIGNATQNEVIEENYKEYCEAILSLIYATRCNMFHGHKSHESCQMEILPSMASILEEIIKEVRERLGANPNNLARHGE